MKGVKNSSKAHEDHASGKIIITKDTKKLSSEHSGKGTVPTLDQTYEQETLPGGIIGLIPSLNKTCR